MNLQLQFLCFVVATTFYNATFEEVSGYMTYNDGSKCIAYKALSALFGPQLPADGQTYFMRVTPPNSCRATETLPASRKTSKAYISLTQRHNCSFVEEIVHAQQAGYQTTTVHYVDPEQWVTVMAGNKEIKQLIKIPSLFSRQSVSLYLQRASQWKKKVHRALHPKYYLDLSRDNAKMLQAISIMRSFGVVFHIIDNIVAAFSIIVVMSSYKRACKTKLHAYEQGDKYETCVICLADYQKGDHLKVLSCSHAYHSTCIDTWFHKQSGKMTCPICQQVVNI